MRPIYQVPGEYHLLYDARLNHQEFHVAVTGLDPVNPLPQTLRIRDRLGVNPRLNGDGPFFGANIPPYSVTNSLHEGGYWDFWMMATGNIVGDFYRSQYGHRNRHVFFSGEEVFNWYPGILDQPYHGQAWPTCQGDFLRCVWTDLFIDGVRQWKTESWQFYLPCYSGEKCSWGPIETWQFVKHYVEMPMHITPRDGLEQFAQAAFIQRAGREYMQWELAKHEIQNWQEPTANLLERDEWCRAEALASGIATNFYFSGCNAAFQQCVDNLPELTVNTAQNLVDIVEAVWSLMTGGFKLPKLGLKTLPKTAGDAWMFYRYVYTTSKADLEEYVALTNRLARLVDDLPPSIYSYGQYRDDVYTFHCVMRISTASILPKGARSWLKKYGLKLSIADLWDDVPYSFVVDWFLNLGSIFEYVDGLGRAAAYRNEECWYSVCTAYNGINTYCRVPGNVIPYFPPAFHWHEARLRTWFKRIIDGLVLIGP